MAEALLAAIIGGSIGSGLTMLAGVPAEVRQHDRQVREADKSLSQWVADECVRLERDLNRVLAEMSAEGQRYSGALGNALAAAKEQTLHAYRDQETQSERRRDEVRAAEGWRHVLWRRLTRRGGLPELSTPQRAEPILDDWRADATYADIAPTPVNDPTRRTLDQALEKLGEDRQHGDDERDDGDGKEGSRQLD
jgi:hypothetical protein